VCGSWGMDGVEEMVDIEAALKQGWGRPKKSKDTIRPARKEMDPPDPHKGSVTDSREGVCVDPGEKGAILEIGGPPRQEREKAGSWLQTVEEDTRSEMAKDAGDGLATSSRDVYAQSECYCALRSSYTV
jgi:hypothetical protein